MVMDYRGVVLEHTHGGTQAYSFFGTWPSDCYTRISYLSILEKE